MVQQARLIHGSSYTLNGGRGGKSKVFRRSEAPDDDWVTVSEKERVWLEENALERCVVQQSGTKRTQFIPKFEFRAGSTSGAEVVEETGEGDMGAAAPRKRIRKA